MEGGKPKRKFKACPIGGFRIDIADVRSGEGKTCLFAAIGRDLEVRWSPKSGHAAKRGAGRGTFVPLAFEPGETVPVDWSGDRATIGGAPAKLQVVHVKLAHSRVAVAARTGGAAMAIPSPGLSAAGPCEPALTFPPDPGLG
uniref:hypothetical protein n=1 Tax=Mangrovicoccus ximenensis TaxID=1911570 RepID=UPI0038B28375